MKAGEDPEPVDEGGDPACWLHEFEDELLGDGTDEDDDTDG